MRNGGRVLLPVQNLYVRIKIRVAIFDIKYSVTQDSCTWEFIVSKDGMVCNVLIFWFNNDFNFLVSETSLKCTEK